MTGLWLQACQNSAVSANAATMAPERPVPELPSRIPEFGHISATPR